MSESYEIEKRKKMDDVVQQSIRVYNALVTLINRLIVTVVEMDPITALFCCGIYILYNQ